VLGRFFQCVTVVTFLSSCSLHGDQSTNRFLCLPFAGFYRRCSRSMRWLAIDFCMIGRSKRDGFCPVLSAFQSCSLVRHFSVVNFPSLMIRRPSGQGVGVAINCRSRVQISAAAVSVQAWVNCLHACASVAEQYNWYQQPANGRLLRR